VNGLVWQQQVLSSSSNPRIVAVALSGPPMHASIGQRTSALGSGLVHASKQAAVRARGLRLLQRPGHLRLQSQQRDVPQPAAAAEVEAKQQLDSVISSKQKQQQQQQQQPDPRRPGPLRWLRNSVSRLPFFAKAEEGQQARLDIKSLLQQLRVLILGCMMGCVLLVVRYSMLHQARTAPREVLYSDFVTLLDTGKVKAARLEAASSKLLFELHPQEPAAAAAGAVTGKAASSKSSKSSSIAADAAAAVGAKAEAPKPAAHKRFFIKLADKQDPLLVGKVLTAGACTHTRMCWG